jgi:hypothetical protein
LAEYELIGVSNQAEQEALSEQHAELGCAVISATELITHGRLGASHLGWSDFEWKKLDPYRETARMVLEPWLVQGCLGPPPTYTESS